MSKYTKIVATISDARCDVDFIKQLYESGMNVVRMNSAHLQEEGFQKIIDNVRAVSNKIAILMDTKGPEVRTTALSGDSNILFSTGDIVGITGKRRNIDRQRIYRGKLSPFCRGPFHRQPHTYR